MQGGWSRRAVLGAVGAGAAGVLSGCSWFGAGEPSPPPPPDPLEPLLAATRGLAARYQAVIDTHPGLADRLRPLHQAHLVHVDALVAVIGRPELASPSADPASWASPLDPRQVGSADPDQALALLRDAERDAQAESRQACLAAPPQRAALLGSITAARATHAEVLG